MLNRFANIIILGLIMGGAFVSPVFASNDAIKPFKITLHTTTQDPKSKAFEIIAVVNSVTKNDRVTITWNLPTGLIPLDELDVQKNVSINVGDNFYSVEVIPEGGFQSYVNFTIESYASTTRVLYNQRGYIEVMENLDLYPTTDYYNTLSNYYKYQDFAWIVFWIFLVFGLIFSLASFIVNKYFREEERPQTPRNSRILTELERRRLEENIPLSQS